MAEPLIREVPLRAVTLRRNYADDDEVGPGVRAPRRAVLEGPDTAPTAPPAPARSTLTLGRLAQTVLALINRGAREDHRVVGITPAGDEVPLADIEIRDHEGD